jgi:uncharacterized protein YhbP (UPF0306 family)
VYLQIYEHDIRFQMGQTPGFPDSSDLKFVKIWSSLHSFTMAANLEAECYFCGNPNAFKRLTSCKVALYCSTECQTKHSKLGLREDCLATAIEEEEQNQNISITIHKADYYSYISTLPDLEEEECNLVFDYHVVATKDSPQVDLGNSIDYPLPGPNAINTSFDFPTACKPSSRTEMTRQRT